MIANPAGCPTLEDIAAFAEGRLTGAERDRVVAHLAGCAECRELFAETAKGLEDLGDAAGAATEASRTERAPVELAARRKRGPRPAPWMLAVAATLALVGGFLGYRALVQPQPPDRGEWLASMPPAEQMLPALWGGTVMRGGEDTEGIAQRSAELGALLVDLEVAMAAGDDDRTRAIALRLAALVDEAGLLDREVATLRRLATGDRSNPGGELRTALPAIESRLRDRFDPFHLDLGSFTEQVRLAASAGQQSLREPAARRYLEWLLEQEREPLSAATRQGLQALSADAEPGDQATTATTLLRHLTHG